MQIYDFKDIVHLLKLWTDEETQQRRLKLHFFLELDRYIC